MLEELERRNYSAGYHTRLPRAVEDFARYFKRPPDQLGPDHIREYQAYLFRERKLSPNTRYPATRRSALLLHQDAQADRGASNETPYPKKSIASAVDPQPGRGRRLIESAPTPFQRTLLMTLYATGLRRAELAHLKVSDIDSQRNGDSRPGRQGTQRSGCHAQPNSARRTA